MPCEFLPGFPVTIELPVVWGEMDAYRHVNNAVYFRYFESARLEYFRCLDWDAFEKQTGIGPILAATEARYRKPLKYPDRIWVGASIPEIGIDRFTMEYRIYSTSLGCICTEGNGTIVSYNYHEKKKVSFPDELRARIEKLQGRAK